jgi:hypothetical protein
VSPSRDAGLRGHVASKVLTLTALRQMQTNDCGWSWTVADKINKSR